MRFLVLIAVFLVLLALRRFKPSMLVWLAAWWVGLFVVIRFGFTTPVPASVVQLYMSIVTGALLIYTFADEERLEEVRRPVTAFLVERRFQPLLALVVLAIPALVALGIYLDMTAPPTVPNFARTVHPASPEEIEVHGATYKLNQIPNPYRQLEQSDPDAFAAHLANGRRIYYENCFYCHGDLMEGDGMFAHGLNPIPTNFQDAGTIQQLQESFLFWRISKGAPGLPAEGGPWDSFMPAWESFLEEEEMWDVILFLYEFTGYRPRAVHEGVH